MQSDFRRAVFQKTELKRLVIYYVRVFQPGWHWAVPAKMLVNRLGVKKVESWITYHTTFRIIESNLPLSNGLETICHKWILWIGGILKLFSDTMYSSYYLQNESKHVIDGVLGHTIISTRRRGGQSTKGRDDTGTLMKSWKWHTEEQQKDSAGEYLFFKWVCVC